jgi:hypothetical protein
LLTAKYNIAEFVETFFTYQPLGRPKRSVGETFAASRYVPESDRIRRRIESDFMRAGMRSGSIRAYIDLPRVACFFHFFD